MEKSFYKLQSKQNLLFMEEAIKEAINSDITTVIDIKMETFYPPKELRL